MALRAVPKMTQSLGRLGNASLPRLNGRRSCFSRLSNPSREITACSQSLFVQLAGGSSPSLSRRIHRPSQLPPAACFPPGYTPRASSRGPGLLFADYLVRHAFWRCERPSPVSLVSEIPLADLSCRWHLVCLRSLPTRREVRRDLELLYRSWRYSGGDRRPHWPARFRRKPVSQLLRAATWHRHMESA